MDNNNHFVKNHMNIDKNSKLQKDNEKRRQIEFIQETKQQNFNKFQYQTGSSYSKNFIPRMENFSSNNYNRKFENGYNHNLNKNNSSAHDDQNFLKRKKYMEHSDSHKQSNTYQGNYKFQKNEQNEEYYNQASNLNLNEEANLSNNLNKNQIRYKGNNLNQPNYSKHNNQELDNFDDDYNNNLRSNSDNKIQPHFPNEDFDQNQEVKRSISDNMFDKKNQTKPAAPTALENINFNQSKNHDFIINLIDDENKEIIINKDLNSKHPKNLEDTSPERPKQAAEFNIENKNSNIKFFMKEFSTEKEELENINKQDAYLKTKRKIKNISNFQKIEEIGEGTYGRVCKYK